MDLSMIPIGAYAPRWFMKDHHCNVVLLAGFVGKAIAPNAIGQPYVKER